MTSEAEVYIRNLSTRPIYIQSHYLDREGMRVSGDVSHVIYQQAVIKVCFYFLIYKLNKKNFFYRFMIYGNRFK